MPRQSRSSSSRGRAGAGSSPRRPAFIRGEAGRKRVEAELEDQKRRREARESGNGKPMRFWVPQGETKEIAILDEEPDFFLYEHQLKNPQTNRWDIHTGCVKEFDNCPVCEQTGQESYYAMILSVIDLTPYENKQGEEVPFSRKMMVVKVGQQKKFLRVLEREGSLRGAIFEMSRDGAKDPTIGNDIQFVEFMDEDELGTYTRTWTDREKKEHTEDCSQPYEYEKIFEEPTVDSLRALVGGSPTPGSRDQVDKEFDDDSDDWESETEDSPWEEEKPASRRSARSRPSRASTGSDDESESESESESDDGEEDKTPARAKRSTRARSARKSEPEPEKKAPARRGGRVMPRRSTRK